MKHGNQPAPEPSQHQEPSWVTLVRQQVASLRFGIVQIVVHDSQVVQLERSEKLRLAPAGQPAPSTRHRGDAEPTRTNPRADRSSGSFPSPTERQHAEPDNDTP